MKKIVILVLVLCLTLSLFTGCGSEDRSTVLKVYNWADYIDEGLIEEFEAYYFEKYGVELTVQYDTFDTNEIMYNKIAQAKEDYDVVCPSEYMIERMVKGGLALPIEAEVVEIYNNAVPDFITENFSEMAEKDGNTYAVGYMWGTMGIMYNVNEVSKEDLENLGWGVLWSEKYANKIFMKDSIRDSFAIGNLYAFEKQYKDIKADLEAGKITVEEYQAEFAEIFNDTSLGAISAVENVLTNQKKTVNAMYDVDNDKNSMVNGTAYLDVCWSGDAMWAIWEAEVAGNGVELGYYIPESGTNIWFDGWLIPKYAGNTQAANEWIAFMLAEENAIANVDYIGYTSVVSGNGDLFEYVGDYAFETDEPCDASYFFGEDGKGAVLNSTMYPDASVVLSAGVMRDFGEAEGNITEMWTRLKGNEMSFGVVAVIGGAVVVFAVLVIMKMKKKSKKKSKAKSKRRSGYTPE